MKQIALILLLVSCLIAPVQAIEKVMASGGCWVFMSPGHDTELGWSASLDLPPGINIKKIKDMSERLDALTNSIVVDTTYYSYYEILLRGTLVHSRFQGFNTIEVEAANAILLNRKSTGIGNLYADVGGTYWEFTNAAGNNEQLIGYYVGMAYQAIGLEALAGCHFLTLQDKRDVYIAGLQIGYWF